MGTSSRKLVAVGDLHGDVHRLIRILIEQQLLDQTTLEWTPNAALADVILLGDYVDWRGETLEGPREEWPFGVKKLLELLHKLHEQVKEHKKNNYTGNFYPLLGNHDAMMLEGYQFLKDFSKANQDEFAHFESLDALLNFFASAPLQTEEEYQFLKLHNWLTQGGDNTIQSFGGLHAWFAAMEGELGQFLHELNLAVMVNQKLFSHSIPDSKEYWTPIHEGEVVSKEVDEKMREQYLWGRKVWGYDAFSGGPTSPLSEKEVDEMLKKLNVNAVVIGHTSLRKKTPYFHFGGKVINLDSHGIPGSEAFVEEYVVS